jgi:hypothetical protein
MEISGFEADTSVTCPKGFSAVDPGGHEGVRLHAVPM